MPSRSARAASLPRTFIIAFAVLLLAPTAAQAWQVNISILGGGTVTETTPANLVSGCTSNHNTPTGTLGQTCNAGTVDGPYGHGWDVDYVATPKSGYRFVEWRSDGRTSPGPVICDRSTPAATSSTYTGATCKFRTFANLQVAAVFVDDTSPTMTSLSGPNAAVKGPATFTFSAAADPTFRRFECRVADVHDWEVCVSGRQEDPATSGTYTFQVRAIDMSNNVSSESTWQWVVDKTPPETTLLSSGPNGLTNSRTAKFDFTSNEAGTFTCLLTGQTSSPCSSGMEYTNLADGTYTFTVTARDGVGNADPTPAGRTFTVDTTPPETNIGSGPLNGWWNSRSAQFTFWSEAGATLRCVLDGDESPCNSGTKSYTGLLDGPHTFSVIATDQAGNPDASPATRTFTVDATPPETTLDGAVGPTGSTTARTARFAFSSPGDPGARLFCSLNGEPPLECTSPHELSSLAVGEHTFSVVAIDSAGNMDPTPATRTWTITNPVTPPKPPTKPKPKPKPPGGGGGGSNGSGGSAPSGTPAQTVTAPSSGGSAAAGPGGGPLLSGPARGNATLDRGGRFTIPGLRLTCPSRCTASIRITAKRRVLGSARVTPNAAGGLRVKLSARGLAAVKRAKRLRTTVVVSVPHGSGGASLSKSMTLTLRAPRR